MFSRSARTNGANILRKIRAGMAEVVSNAGATNGDKETPILESTQSPSEAAHRLGASTAEGSAANLMRGRVENSEDESDSAGGALRNVITSTMKSIVESTKTEVTSQTPNFFVKVEQQGKTMMEDVSKNTHIPFWAIFIIFIVIVGIFALVFFCCLQRWWRKFRGKEGGKGFMGGKVDLKSVQLLGQTYKEKVQPDMEELTKDMEQNEAGKEETKEEVKLGRLQFKIDYDFNQSQVITLFDLIWWLLITFFPQQLGVGVLQAEDLPGLDMSGTSDPYVKVTNRFQCCPGNHS